MFRDASECVVHGVLVESGSDASDWERWCKIKEHVAKTFLVWSVSSFLLVDNLWCVWMDDA